MSIKRNCPCDLDSVCPYESENWGSCEYWCGSEEPQDDPDLWDECPEAEDGFWIRSSEEIEPAPADEVLGWDIVESL